MTFHSFPDWTPSAVVFDCDGTLTDTERHWQTARDDVLIGHGVVPDPEFAEASRGVHYTDCGRMMAEFAGRPERTREMTAQLLDAFRKRVAAALVPTEGAAAMVAGTAGFARIAVASNCPLDVVESCLAATGLLRYVERVVVPGGGVRPKPAPDPYLTAVRALDTAPAQALAVEDSVCGLRSAAAAGLRVLGVGLDPTPEALTLADWWVPSLADPALTAWLAARADHPLPPAA